MEYKRTYDTTEERKLRATNKWKEKSLQIREDANNLCEVCRDEGIYTYDNLEVHHIEKIKNNKELLLDDFNLICLCTEHHKQADADKLDNEYLKKLARDRVGRKYPRGYKVENG